MNTNVVFINTFTKERIAIYQYRDVVPPIPSTGDFIRVGDDHDYVYIVERREFDYDSTNAVVITIQVA